MKIMYFIAVLFIFLTSMSTACPSDIDKNSKIDQTIFRMADVDGDDVLDKIQLHMSANNLYSVLSWELKIISKDKVIYSRCGSSERIEGLFSDPNYVGGCSGYDDCKCQWYFKGFFDRLIVRHGPDNVWEFSRTSPNSIYSVAKKALKKELKKNPTLVEQAINNAVKRLSSGKAVVIEVFDEPEIHTPPMVWMPEFDRFVPIYQQ